MWGIVFRSALDAAGGYFIALIVERTLGVMLTLAEDAPNSDGSSIVGAMQTAQENFLLLIILGIVLTFLARAHVESQLAGGLG